MNTSTPLKKKKLYSEIAHANENDSDRYDEKKRERAFLSK